MPDSQKVSVAEAGSYRPLPPYPWMGDMQIGRVFAENHAGAADVVSFGSDLLSE